MTNQPFFWPSLIIFIGTIPLILGLIPRNRIYGIRLAKTLASDEAWYRANRFGGIVMLIGSLIYLAVAAVIPTAGRGAESAVWWIHFGAFAGPFAIGIFLIRSHVQKL